MQLNQEIKQCLQQITQPQTEDPQALVAALRRVDALAQSVDLPKELAHYLHKRSYSKALKYLQGDDAIPKGICGSKRNA
jgi:hypothetical protein